MNILETKVPKIRKIEPVGALELLIVYEDNQKKRFNVAPYLAMRPDIFAPLSDEKLFRRVRTDILGRALIWNKNIDISGYDVWEAGVTV